MNIDKEVLKQKFKEEDWNFVFRSAHEITSVMLVESYNIFDIEKREEMIQECLENLWKKIMQGKVDASKNIFSFIWKNSWYRAGEILRKENRRNGIAAMTPYETIEEDSKDFFDATSRMSNKYVSQIVKELSTQM